MAKVTNKDVKTILNEVIIALETKPEDDIISSDEILNRVKADLEAFDKWDDIIKPYDEICDKNDSRTKLVVTAIGAWGDWQCIDKEGYVFAIGTEYMQHWKRTGKSYPELANILGQLKEGKE